MEKNMYN